MNLKTTYFKIILLLFATMFGLTNIRAQYASQDELKTAAQSFFDQENYIDALPLYSQLLSLYPKDPDYNYRYGASYFFGNREKEMALKYLRFAVTKATVNPQAFYFLATALHHEYLFKEAELNYNKFKEKGVAKDIQRFAVDRKIEMCRNGITLLKSMTDIGVLVKKEIKATDFFRSYDLKGIGGKIIVKPDEFKTKLDLKKNESSIIHLGDNSNMVLFSSYGNDEKSGKDIYKVVKLPNGEWSKPTPFPKINTNFDEDYPFLHPDGKTLYFSSKGYNSMGGYDIFKSTLDPTSGEWSFPENLDFPINTPDDDILFITDIDNQLAYFASSRASKQGELTVYKVQVKTQPSENTIVKGIFIAESNLSMKSATITIMDAVKDKKYGVFSTNNTTGDYLLVFPGNGGKFKILVETTNNAPIHTALIELPALEGFRALKQELRLVGEGNDEKLVVKNLFNESDEFEITDPLVVENLLKYKAKMDVNITEDELVKNNDNSKSNTEVSTLANVSNEQMVENAQKGSSTIAQNAKLSRNQSNLAFGLAAKKSAEAKSLFNQYQQKASLAKESQDATAFKESEKLKLQVAQLVNEAISASDLAKTIESEAVERESDVNKSAELSSTISAKINAGNRNEAEINYKKLDEISNSTYNKESALNTEKTILENKLSEKELEYTKIRNNVIELTNKQTALVENIDALKEKITKTSKKADKDALQSEVDALTIDLEDAKYDLGVAADKESKTNQELKALKNNYNVSTSVIASVSNTNAQTPAKVIDKAALDNDILFFEKQGLVGLYPTDEVILAETPTEKYDLQNHKNEFSIISEDGKIIDYSSKHSSEIVDAQQNTDENQKSLAMAKVNQDWITDINQEISIRENQLKAADNLNEKTKLASRVEVLKNLKAEKQKEVDQYLVAAQENKSSEKPTESAVKTSTASSNKIESANITDANGNIINYAANYENQLAALDEKESTPATINEKIAVYEQWKNANEQELLLKKIELKSAEGEEKIDLVNRIEELENQVTSNKEYIALYKDKVGENNVVSNENTNTPKSNQPTKNIDYAQYDSKVVSPNGEVLDYGADYDNQFKIADKIVDPLTSNKEKEKIVGNRMNSVNEELKFKNDQLAIASESEKAPINERINSLKDEKAALNNQLSELSLAVKQQESLMALKNMSPTNANNNTTEQPVVKNTATITSDSPYSSTQAAKEFEPAKGLTETIADLNKQAEEKTTLAYATKDEKKKEQLLTDASNLKVEQEAKQIELARVYEKSNKAEYYNNQEAISKVKQNTNTTSDNTTIAELNVDEANTYFDKAQEERDKAVASTSFSAKESANEKAELFEKTAIEKQRKAIELYSGKSSNEVLASIPKENITPVNKSITVNNTSTVPNNTVQNSTVNTQTKVAANNNAISNTPIYQPASVSMPSDAEKFKAKSAENEAERLEKAALVLQDSAQKSTNKTEKAALIAESTSNKEKATRLRKEAEVSYATANELAVQEKGTVEEINNNRLAISNEKFSAEDQNQINTLSSSEIQEIKNSPEYVAFTNEKQESRRLVKEAEVDYIKADKFEEEAGDQKTLGISLNAMAAGAQGDGKTKLLGQIEKLNGMIQTNESKSSESRTAATNKELIALEKSKKADEILASSEKASSIKVLEKAEAFNVLAETKNIEPIVAVETNPIKNNVNTEVQPELVVEKNNPVEENNLTVKTIQPELAKENNPNTTANKVNTEVQPELAVEKNNPVEENNSTVKTNQPELAKENNTNTTAKNINTTTQPVKNNTNLATVDEIPQVLTDQIFVLTPNKSAAYSDNKKIPSAVKLPEGLVFKVQIGAFRNPIPQDHFRGFAPIMAEDAGGGITRYTAGLFKTFNMANEAKNSIRTIGYPDAFVVAFLNGKRVDVNQARNMVDGTNLAQNGNKTANNTPEVNSTTNNSVATTTTNNTTTINKTIPAPKTNVELVEDGVSTDVNKIVGVFFTIQVGVYSKPITADQLNNVTPLNSERTEYGLIRYTSGVYPTLKEATDAKEKIIALGVTDAFVVAYANGNRVSVNEAINFVSANSSNAAKPTNNTNTPVKPAVNTNTGTPTSTQITPSNTNTTITNNTKLPVENNTSTNTAEPLTPENSAAPVKEPINQVEVGKELKIEYKVLLGEYTDEIPVEDAAAYLKLSGRGVKITEVEGKTIYTIGSYPDYPSALDLQIEMKLEGIKAPKVIAFKDGTPIEVNEALELVKNHNK